MQCKVWYREGRRQLLALLTNEASQRSCLFCYRMKMRTGCSSLEHIRSSLRHTAQRILRNISSRIIPRTDVRTCAVSWTLEVEAAIAASLERVRPGQPTLY